MLQSTGLSLYCLGVHMHEANGQPMLGDSIYGTVTINQDMDNLPQGIGFKFTTSPPPPKWPALGGLSNKISTPQGRIVTQKECKGVKKGSPWPHTSKCKHRHACQAQITIHKLFSGRSRRSTRVSLWAGRQTSLSASKDQHLFYLFR